MVQRPLISALTPPESVTSAIRGGQLLNLTNIDSVLLRVLLFSEYTM